MPRVNFSNEIISKNQDGLSTTSHTIGKMGGCACTTEARTAAAIYPAAQVG
jgi:hypothetical protein